jgi:serine-type D-Ala-D-Ala carboxypeptidase (penicillin-binding protein 5/6)
MKFESRFITQLLAVSVVGLLAAACGNKQEAPAVVSTMPAIAKTAPPAIPIPAPPVIPGTGYVLTEFSTGQVLAAKNESARLEPASLTKIMTAYVVFDALRAGSLSLNDSVTISEHAWRSGGAATDGSTSFLPVHSQVPVEVLLQGMIVQSGNDASIALAERVAGSEDAFAQLMNSYAKRLGMTSTHFENATGLPGNTHYTTAHDMALLAQAVIRDFPQYYHYFSEQQYTYNGITQHNRNGLLTRDSTVDGLKTGHTEKAGYCLVTSAKRNEMRVIAVVMGTSSVSARESANAALLSYAFSFYEAKQVLTANQVMGNTRVWKGTDKIVNVVLDKPISVVVPRGRAVQIESRVSIPRSIVAPIQTSAPLGALELLLDGKSLATVALHAQKEVPEAGLFGRWIDSLRMKFE